MITCKKGNIIGHVSSTDRPYPDSGVLSSGARFIEFNFSWNFLTDTQISPSYDRMFCT
jgi:hypothetical protein